MRASWQTRVRGPIVRIVNMLRQCVMKNPAAGGGRWVEVPPERLVSWIVTFARRHGGAALVAPVARDEAGVTVTFTTADGATAECPPPFPPFPSGRAGDGGAGDGGTGDGGAGDMET